MSFGERHARWASVVMAALGVVVAIAAFGAEPSRALLLAAVVVLACAPGFRRRRRFDAQRPRQVLEDERDAAIARRSDACARAVLAAGAVALAASLCVPAIRSALLAGELALPGLLLLLVVASALAGHAAAIAAYRRERR